MRTLKLSCAKLALLLMLATPVLAGDMQTGKPAPQPTPTITQKYTEEGKPIATCSAQIDECTQLDPISEIALTLLTTVLSLF